MNNFISKTLSDKMKIISIFTQISICLASSGPKIIAESDQEVFEPFIDNFQPTVTQLPGQGTHSIVVVSSTATPRFTTISWRWFRITKITEKIARLRLAAIAM